MKILDMAKGAVALIIFLGAFFSVYKYLDTRYALADDVVAINNRLENKIANDQKIDTQKELRDIKERNLGKPEEKWSKEDRDRKDVLENQLKDILEQIKSLMPKKK
jgi:hypothetical protein